MYQTTLHHIPEYCSFKTNRIRLFNISYNLALFETLEILSYGLYKFVLIGHVFYLFANWWCMRIPFSSSVVHGLRSRSMSISPWFFYCPVMIEISLRLTEPCSLSQCGIRESAVEETKAVLGLLALKVRRTGALVNTQGFRVTCSFQMDSVPFWVFILY
jgi:hypothetical protein